MGRRIQSLADEVVKRMDEQDMRRGSACLGGFRMRSCRGRDLFRRVSQGFRWCDTESELMNASDSGQKVRAVPKSTRSLDMTAFKQTGRCFARRHKTCQSQNNLEVQALKRRLEDSVALWFMMNA